MPNPTAALAFRSVELTEERLLGRPDDHALSTVRFDATYPDGRVEHNVVVQVWRALDPVSEGIVRSSGCRRPQLLDRRGELRVRERLLQEGVRGAH